MTSSENDAWAELDRRDWRADGPFDYAEVDLSDDQVQRLDLGALIVTPAPNSELQLQVREGTTDVLTALCILEDSALELSLFAAPRSGGYWTEVRELIASETINDGGEVVLAAGHFGTELRRIVKVTSTDGKQEVQPSRMFAAEGDRWLLRGVLYGGAAMIEPDTKPAEVLFDVFRDTIVRRDNGPMAPGELIPLTMPNTFD